MVDTRSAAALVEVLRARLAAERATGRLYDELLARVADVDRATRESLAELREDEQRHADLLVEAIEELGGSAAGAGPAGVGGIVAEVLVQVVTSPGATFSDRLEAMLACELIDGAGWEQLVEVCAAVGHSELAARLQPAFVHEERHVELLRDWLLARSIATFR